jgi:hypothetical protein
MARKKTIDVKCAENTHQSISLQVSGLKNYKKFLNLEDHTSCDWYINQLQLAIVRTLENSDLESSHWFSELLKHDLLNMLGQAKNQIKRNCIMRTGETYTHADDINLRLLPKPANWIPVDEALFYSNKNLNEIDANVTHRMTVKQRELKDDLKSACCLLQTEFSKILQRFYQKPVTLEMTSRITTCVLLDYRMDLLKFVQ